MAVFKNTTKALEESLKNLPEPGQRNTRIYILAKRAKNVASREKMRSFLLSVASQWDDRAIARAFEGREAPSPDRLGLSLGKKPGIVVPMPSLMATKGSLLNCTIASGSLSFRF